MLAHLPLLSLNAERVSRVLNGRELLLSGDEAETMRTNKRPLRLCDDKGTLVAVGEYDQSRQTVKPRVVIHEKV
jgi:tRNA U55 pseudouridine synthase TruB